jgi:hypothetical protein
MAKTTEAEVAVALFNGWICRFGVPASITSDRGSHLPLIFGAHCLFCYRINANTTWTTELPWFLLGVRPTPWEDNNISPAQALYDAPLKNSSSPLL